MSARGSNASDTPFSSLIEIESTVSGTPELALVSATLAASALAAATFAAASTEAIFACGGIRETEELSRGPFLCGENSGTAEIDGASSAIPCVVGYVGFVV
jgi:hypothetical protein